MIERHKTCEWCHKAVPTRFLGFVGEQPTYGVGCDPCVTTNIEQFGKNVSFENVVFLPWPSEQAAVFVGKIRDGGIR